MVKYGVENHGFPNGKKFYSCPIENTFSKIKNVVFLMRKSFFYRVINYAERFENASRPVSRVLFFRQPSILLPLLPTASCDFFETERAAPWSLFVLLRVGFTGTLTLPPQRWALTPPFHPYRNAFGGLFLLHYPWSRLHRPLAGTLLCEARTFLTPTSATVQPTHIIQIIINEFRPLVKP